MNAHLFKHELIRQYWIIEISKEEWGIRTEGIMITILCDWIYHVTSRCDKNIHSQGLHFLPN